MTIYLTDMLIYYPKALSFLMKVITFLKLHAKVEATLYLEEILMTLLNSYKKTLIFLRQAHSWVT
jgi:hypothetical protein